MAIERLNGSHVPFIRDIARLSFPKLWEPREFAYFLDHACGLCLGDFDADARLRGYFLGLLVASDLDVVSVATHPDFRRRGVAENLMRRALAAPGMKRAFLEVDVHNTLAVSLYEKLGFRRTGLRKAYYDNLRDAILMTYSSE